MGDRTQEERIAEFTAEIRESLEEAARLREEAVERIGWTGDGSE